MYPLLQVRNDACMLFSDRFKKIFKVDIKDFVDPIIGFDIAKFDDSIIKSDTNRMDNVIVTKYKEAGLNLIREILKAERAAIEFPK